MESNINHQVIESYAKSYADLVIKNFFEKETSIKGGEISSFSEINQINYFVFQKPRCKVCGGTPKVRSSKHLFLNLTKVAF